MTSDSISQVLKAFSFAAHKHRDQRRKNVREFPYINHLIAVAEILWDRGGVSDIPTLVAGILHDSLEDTDTSFEEIEELFGAEVLSIVQEVTDDKRLPKQERKRLQIERAGRASPQARVIKLADKISNIQDLLESPPVKWSRERRLDYVNWAERVIQGLRGTNEPLEQHFDEVCRQARMTFGPDEDMAQ